jgi:L-fuculose-phosphate aldolase
VFAAYYKMETVEHFAKISLVARLLGGERLLSQQEVQRLQGLRGMYGIASPAPICTDDTLPEGDATCQVVRAPDAPGQRLVPEQQAEALMGAMSSGPAVEDGEIRLTYRELTALIEDAVRQLR